MEKIKKLKHYFKKENIDGYIVPKNDEFFGENVSDFSDRLNFISNFSGSYGFAIILNDINYLFVDGRYTLQAKAQSGKLFKIVTFPDKMPNDILKSKKLKIGNLFKSFVDSLLPKADNVLTPSANTFFLLVRL